MYGGESGGLGELTAAPFLAGQQISYCAFDSLEEGLWVGTDEGVIGQLTCPTLDRYCSNLAHDGRVLDLKSVGEGAVSVSSNQLSLHASGGVPRLHFRDEVGNLSCVELEGRGTLHAAVGRDSGGIMLFDLAAGRPSGKLDTGGKGVVRLCGPVARGSLVMATTDGYFSQVDARAAGGSRAAEAVAPLLAHAGGFAAIDGRGNFVATAGYATRMGRVMLENHVKVFDVRMAPRMLSSIPFAPGPTLVKFHPKFSSTVLVGSAGGLFSLADVQGLGINTSMYQVDTEGDVLLCCGISLSGECMAFGGSGGYIHLWATSSQPSVSGMGQSLTHPEPFTPLVCLGEDDPLCLAPLYYCMDGTLLSDVGPYETASVGLGPRVVDASLLKNLKQSEFVGYITNPKYKREAPPGVAARAVWLLRNQRVEPRPEKLDQEAARAERARRRAAAGGIVLPGRYRRVAIKSQSTLRFEEFDFSYYNRTPFAGLENDLANCYTNALLQVLFFTPPMRDAMLQHVPDLQSEFCLTGEMSFLFRMMAGPGATICQASNLLRALRQSREAAALGLLEGVRGERGSNDIEVEAHKERSLSSRVQSLARFVLEQLHKEALGAAAARPATSAPISSTASPVVGTAEAAAAGGSAGGVVDVVDNVYGMLLAQRTQCLSRKRPDIIKETHTFQVDLQYPSLKDWPFAPPVPVPNLVADQDQTATPAIATRDAVAAPPAGFASPSYRNTAAAESLLGVKAEYADSIAAISSSGSNGTDAEQEDCLAGPAGSAVPGALPPPPSAPTRPKFSEVLQASLHTRSEMRAWFDDAVKYQFVRQERVPSALPQVLVLNCGLKDRNDLRWWQPYEGSSKGGVRQQEQQEGEEDGHPAKRRRSWLPPALAITTNPHEWAIEVEEGDSVESLLAADACAAAAPAAPGKAVGEKQRSDEVPPGGTRVVYELTAAICHISDEDEVEEGQREGAGQAPSEYEGHLVAHIRIPPSYYAATQAQHAQQGSQQDTAGASGNGVRSRPGAASGGGNSPATPPASPTGLASHLVHSVGGSWTSSATNSPPQAVQPQQWPEAQPAPALAAAEAEAAEPSGRGAGAGDTDGLSTQDADIIRQASESLALTSSPGGLPLSHAAPQFQWLVFNDFHITPCLEGEVGELFGGQKVPCLLYYTQVDLWDRAAHTPPAPIAPVLSPEAFLQLCKAPPLQGPKVRLHRPTFNPLGPNELPYPGMLLALDAEFVAYSPPDKRLRRGVEVEMRPSRLGLARVSVVRGAGPARGMCCIDDYIRGVEPVYDYLTKYSGLLPGDLESSTSPHYLITLRQAYAKLRYLVDCGCVFVGHGLKKDFRMINIVVPPSQMIDTVDLFHAKRSRKLSLRFLASFLLKANIQMHTHDSIEDACTALRLYEVYQRLMAEGGFEAKLQEMYDWGKVHGWDPVVWKDGKPHPATPATTGAGSTSGPVAAGGLMPSYGHLGMGMMGIPGQRCMVAGRPGLPRR